jgi:hypothetical protein
MLNLLTMLLAARALTAAEYGSLALMLNSGQAWSLLIGAGYSLTLSRFVARPGERSGVCRRWVAEHGRPQYCVAVVCRRAIRTGRDRQFDVADALANRA